MSSHISLDSYVDIAMFFASQGCRYKGDLSPSEYSETNLEISDLTDFREHWSKKIGSWRTEYPGGGKPFRYCEKLEDIKFCTLFLQHPVAAMLLWKVMRAFYNLDHVVCGVLPASRSAVTKWEAMNIFQYLEASEVEEKWRHSLSNMRRDIEAKHVVTKKVSRSKAKKMRNRLEIVSAAKNEDSNAEKSLQEMDYRINDMRQGVDQLERAWEDLQRDFLQELEDSPTAKLMLERIGFAMEKRFSMFNHGLKDDINFTNVPKSHVGNTEHRPGLETFDSEFPNMKTETPQRQFRPLTRTNSMEAVKEYAIVVFMATKQGEATLGAVAIILVLLFCLYQVQWCIN